MCVRLCGRESMGSRSRRSKNDPLFNDCLELYIWEGPLKRHINTRFELSLTYLEIHAPNQCRHPALHNRLLLSSFCRGSLRVCGKIRVLILNPTSVGIEIDLYPGSRSGEGRSQVHGYSFDTAHLGSRSPGTA